MVGRFAAMAAAADYDEEAVVDADAAVVVEVEDHVLGAASLPSASLIVHAFPLPSSLVTVGQSLVCLEGVSGCFQMVVCNFLGLACDYFH